MMPQMQPSSESYPVQQLSRLQSDFETRKKLVGWANSTYITLKQNRSRQERIWYINLAMFRGKQNISIINTPVGTNGFRLLTPPAPPWRVRLVINKIRPTIRREIAKCTAQRPSFIVAPATNEDEDYYAAKAATQILDSIYDDYNIGRVNLSRQWWGSITGTSFIKCYWDKNKIAQQKGPPDPNDPSGQPTDLQGDMCIENLIPFFLFVPDLLEQDINNQPFIFHVYTKSKSWVENYYGKQLVTKMTVKGREGDLLEEAFFDVVGVRKPVEDQYKCMEIWIKPYGHPLFPKGGMITIVGDQLIQVIEEFPYTHKKYPFIKFDHIQSGQFYGTSVIDDLIPLQREYNRSRSQIIEAKNLMAKPKLMGPKGAVDPAKITSEPGQYIPYEPGLGKIEPLPMQNLPPFVSEEVMRIQADMDDISGQHEISRGNTPSQVTAATAISYLQEQDDTMLSEPIQAIEHGMAELGKQILCFVIDYWSQDRLIKVAGKDESFNVTFLKGSALRGNKDVRVEAGSALPHSKAAKQAFLMDLFKMGVFAEKPSEFLKIMDLRGIDKILDDYKVDMQQSQRENIKMAAGMQIMINDFDSHEVHLKEHDRYSKTQEYEMLDDGKKAIIINHRMQHQQALYVNQSKAMQLQGQMGQMQPSPGVNPAQVPGPPLPQMPGAPMPQGGQ
jgi:Bacteriophage head to tail connecting protein